MSTIITLIQAAEVVNQGIVKGAPLGNRFDASQIAPNISEAERRFLKTFINQDFFNDLVAQKNTAPSNYNSDLGPIVLAYPTNTEYETLWTQWLFPYLSKASVHESLDTVGLIIGSNGVFFNESQFTQNAGLSGITYLKDSLMETLKDLQPAIIKFLCDNKADYPLFDSEKYCDDCGDKENSIGRNAGFVLKNKKKKWQTKPWYRR